MVFHPSTKFHLITSIKQNFQIFYWFDSSLSVHLFLCVYWQVVNPHCQEGQELGGFTIYIPHTNLLPNPIYSSPTFSWTWCFPSTIQFVVCVTKVISPPNNWLVFKLPFDRVQPKMSLTISLSSMYRKSFIYSRNRTNYQ